MLPDFKYVDGPAFTKGGKGLGCVRMYERDARAKSFSTARLTGVKTLPTEVDMSDLIFVPPGFSHPDQESNQECVGWSVGGSIYVRQRKMGLAKPIMPSPGGIYYPARARAYGWRNIWDGGCNPNEAWKATQERGIIPYQRWPHSTKTVNTAPDPGAWRYAADNRWLVYRWVLYNEQRRTEEGMRLLASGFPLSAAFTIDQSMEDWGPNKDPWERVGPVIGGHALLIVGYRVLSNGQVVFIYCNSWGKLWGDKGFGLMSQRAFESYETSYIATPDVNGELI